MWYWARAFITSAVIILASNFISESQANGSCAHYGNTFHYVDIGKLCFSKTLITRNGVLFNDPSDTIVDDRNTQVITRNRFDGKIFKQSEIGLLSAFVRLQAEFNPNVSSSYLLGIEQQDFAIGLDALELQLDTQFGTFRLGKLENAGATYISSGFTERGAESLNARSGLGFSFERQFSDFTFLTSISDPRATTSADVRFPNFGFGFKKAIGAWHLAAGIALVNVDDPRANLPLSNAVSLGAPLELAGRAKIGTGAGFSVSYVKPSWAAYIGATHTFRASNDVIFAFSDGFDAASVYAGGYFDFADKWSLAGDISFVSATEKGLRHNGGVETALRLQYVPRQNITIISEIGFSNVDRFGAGEGAFFQIPGDRNFDFRLLIDRTF